MNFFSRKKIDTEKVEECSNFYDFQDRVNLKKSTVGDSEVTEISGTRSNENWGDSGIEDINFKTFVISGIGSFNTAGYSSYDDNTRIN